MIDLHSHILPGIDDGVSTIEEARELARAAAAEGITAIAATPHVREDFRTTPEQMEHGVETLRADFSEQRIDVDVIHGGELDLELLRTLDDDTLRRFSIAQNGRYVLVEFPYFGWPLALRSAIFELQLKGFTPVLAHPERNRDVQSKPERVRELVDAGAYVQVTAASVDGRYGKQARQTVKALVELGCVHVLASDAHHPSVREVGLANAIRELADDELTRYLTETAPASIVAGERVPGPPPRGRKGRRSDG